METKLARFLRYGENGEFVVRNAFGGFYPKGGRFASKNGIPGLSSLRDAFSSRLDDIDQWLQTNLSDFLSNTVGGLAANIDMPSGDPAREAALSEWDSRIAVIWDEFGGTVDQFNEISGRMSDGLAGGFMHVLNEERQRALGIEQYVWRTVGDDQVRSSHEALEGQVFDWDSPGPEGHPGQPFGCRCIAVPYLEDAPPYEPDRGLQYGLAILATEFSGARAAAQDVVDGVIEGWRATPEAIESAFEYF